jgi:hypothetical protein
VVRSTTDSAPDGDHREFEMINTGPSGIVRSMTVQEILAKLPSLSPEDRQILFERLGELQDQDILRGIGPPEWEKKLLDEAIAEFERDGDQGRPWREVMRELAEEGEE